MPSLASEALPDKYEVAARFTAGRQSLPSSAFPGRAWERAPGAMSLLLRQLRRRPVVDAQPPLRNEQGQRRERRRVAAVLGLFVLVDPALVLPAAILFLPVDKFLLRLG